MAGYGHLVVIMFMAFVSVFKAFADNGWDVATATFYGDEHGGGTMRRFSKSLFISFFSCFSLANETQ